MNCYSLQKGIFYDTFLNFDLNNCWVKKKIPYKHMLPCINSTIYLSFDICLNVELLLNLVKM